MLWAFAAQEAMAAEAAAIDAAGVPEILVTARRRVENVQDVPAAISVGGGDLIERSYTVNTGQLSLLVPSLNYSSANPRNTAFTIRGLGSSVVAVSQANDGLEPGVGFYVDQVYHARPATAAFDFVDIDRIEVLRGPQGTLFGKNTTAGAIHIITRAPSFDWQAQGEASYGEYNFFQARAAVSGPLIADKLAFRVSGLTTRRDGVLHNVTTGADQNTLNNQAVRGQLFWKASDALAFRLTGDWSNFKSECCTQVYLRTGTSLRPAARQFPALAASIGYAPPSTNPYDRLTDIDALLAVDTNEGGVSLVTDWDLGHSTITSVTAWRFWNWNAANDRDYTRLQIQLQQGIPSRQDQISQELRMASNGDGPLGYVAGLYFFRQVIAGRPISIYGPVAAYWLIGPTTGTPAVPVSGNLLDGYGQDGRTRFAADSYATFAEVNWKLTDRLTLTGGLRYTIEHKTGDYSTFVFGGLQTSAPALLNAKLSILRPQTYSARDDTGDLSGRANISYRFADDIFAYASCARGFKSGGINMSGLPLNAQNQPVLSTAVIAPERNTTYEGGLKIELFDERLRVNIAGYYTEVRDFQATLVDSTQTVALRGYLSNIPRVTVQGFELDAIVAPLAGLQLRASVAYADGQYAEYPQGPCPLERQGNATTACDLTGGRLSGLPRWSTTIGGDYAVPLFANGEAFVHADSSWRNSYFGDPTLSRFTLIDAYNVTNASVGYRSAKGWSVAVFARNLFNSNYLQNLTTQAGNSGLILGTPSDPRIIGVTVGLNI
ncbi:MAG: TonB-dependent receptor [Tardiphaga sp.]|uniref:TonB-dependent receptor n=1 Tax=Tardiphaga sp. TaxID=1926292 RepID=UPI0019AF22FE|nr:TonB-dependent receptor [Tardiphaga sp.]MBC7583108.1 TonB-dependent receptor [Tardiphaga sp.]